jgi:hypothetical protein
MAITDEDGTMLNPNNVNKLLICKSGKGCLSFGQIFNKCSDYSNCDSHLVIN